MPDIATHKSYRHSDRRATPPALTAVGRRGCRCLLLLMTFPCKAYQPLVKPASRKVPDGHDGMQVYELLLNISLIGCSLMVAWKMLMQLSGRGTVRCRSWILTARPAGTADAVKTECLSCLMRGDDHARKESANPCDTGIGLILTARLPVSWLVLFKLFGVL